MDIGLDLDEMKRLCYRRRVEVADFLSISLSSLFRKLNGKTAFTWDEINLFAAYADRDPVDFIKRKKDLS